MRIAGLIVVIWLVIGGLAARNATISAGPIRTVRRSGPSRERSWRDR
jgi:hypothetical protein